MGYMPIGDVTSSDFNSTRTPGVCKPTNFGTLDTFKKLQGQLNRVAQVKGYTKIAIDGDIGPGTVGLIGKVLGVSGTCTQIATNAEVYTLQASTLADSLNAPAKVSGPAPIRPPSIIDPKGIVIPEKPSLATSVSSAFSGLGTIGIVATIGIIGGIGYFMMKPKRKRR